MKKLFLTILFLIVFLRGFSQISATGLRFDGTDDGVKIQLNNPVPFYIGTGAVTIEAWFKCESPYSFPGGEQEIVSVYPASMGFRLAIYNGELAWAFNGIGNTYPGYDFRDSICHHIAVVDSQGGAAFYIDGTFYSSVPSNAGNISIAGPIFIGKNEYSGSHFHGQIKEVRFWNVARTASEIQNNMNTVLSGAANPNLIGYWRCDEGSGTVIHDYSLSGNNGTVGDPAIPNSSPVFTMGCTSCIPVPIINYSGSVPICNGAHINLTVPSYPGSTFQWFQNGSPVGMPNYLWYDVSTAGNYTVAVTNFCGTGISNAANVTVNPNPYPVILANGPLTFCSGSTVTLNTTNSSGATYAWKKNNNPIPGATSATYIVNTSGKYKVTKTNSNGCTGTSSANTITVMASPSATLTPQGPTTFCNGDSVQLKANYNASYIYQWKKNNANISGATSNKYLSKTAGNYKVKETNANGCTALSSIITVSVPCRESENILPDGNSFIATVYPNPSSTDFILRIENGFLDNFSVKFFDLIGKEIFPNIEKISESEFRITNLKQGIYSAVIKHQTTIQYLKLIKLTL